MSGVYIHDGRRIAHRAWTVEAIRGGAASGGIVTPFGSPRVARSRHPNGRDLVDSIRGAGGDVLFDPMTHARLLGSSDNLDFYDEWELWGPAGVGLETPSRRREHVERVFARQTSLGVPLLTPTAAIDSIPSSRASEALQTARVASGMDAGAWQSLAGTRTFWAAGADLDAYIGELVDLRSPVWVLSLVNEFAIGPAIDFAHGDAIVGLLRSIHSLSLRSRVIVAQADYAGLLYTAAGADTIGSGWDRGQRTFDPRSYHIDSNPGPRIPASYVTHGGLNAVLRRDVAEAIERWDPTRALVMRGGGMPVSDNAERIAHLLHLSTAVDAIAAHAVRRDRVDQLRSRYRDAGRYFGEIEGGVPGRISASTRASWLDDPASILEDYAAAEGL